MTPREDWSVAYDADNDRGTIAYIGPVKNDQLAPPSVVLQFQNGPIQDNGINGIQNEELLELELQRLRALNERFPCRENALAITNIEQGLMWLNRRTELRQLQGVEGRNLPHES